MEKYYVRQSFTSVDLITVEEHPKYESLYKVTCSMTNILNVAKSLCFNTAREALNHAVCKLISNKNELETKILRINVKLNKLQKFEEECQQELDNK